MVYFYQLIALLFYICKDLLLIFSSVLVSIFIFLPEIWNRFSNYQSLNRREPWKRNHSSHLSLYSISLILYRNIKIWIHFWNLTIRIILPSYLYIHIIISLFHLKSLSKIKPRYQHQQVWFTNDSLTNKLPNKIRKAKQLSVSQSERPTSSRRGEQLLRLHTVIYDIYQFVGIVLKRGRKLLNGPKNGVTGCHP